jgi:hypothetical protein
MTSPFFLNAVYSEESLKGAGFIESNPGPTVPCRHAIVMPYTNLLPHYPNYLKLRYAV